MTISGQMRVINISYLGRIDSAEYRLFGIGTDGIRYFLFVPNSGNMILRNRGTFTDGEGGTNVGGGFANITVDLATV